MPAKNADLHGNAPDTKPVALLLLDVMNDMEYPGGDALLDHALPMAHHLADLKRRAKERGIPCVYVNDNFGKWQSDFPKLVSHCLEDDVRGHRVAGLLRPDDDDYFVLKPKNSGFFSTTLGTLLAYLQATTIILTGLTGDVCVLFTANDAYMRDFHLNIPADCVASIDSERNRMMLEYMKEQLKADITPSTRLDLDALLRSAREARAPR